VNEVFTRPGRAVTTHVGIGTSGRLLPAQVRRNATRVRVLMAADPERRTAEHWACRIGLAGVALEQVLRTVAEDEG
jgi:hypothetical protein